MKTAVILFSVLVASTGYAKENKLGIAVYSCQVRHVYSPLPGNLDLNGATLQSVGYLDNRKILINGQLFKNYSLFISHPPKGNPVDVAVWGPGRNPRDASQISQELDCVDPNFGRPAGSNYYPDKY